MENSNELNCLLCLTTNPVLTKIFSEDGEDLNIASILKLHFWFEIKEDDPTNNYCICTSCWLNLENFHLFYMKVSEIHKSDCSNNIKKEVTLLTTKQETETTINEFLEVELESQLIKEYSKNDESENEDEKIDEDDPMGSDTDYKTGDDNNDNEDENDDEDDNCEDKKRKKSKRKLENKTKSSSKGKYIRKNDLETIEKEDAIIQENFKMSCELCPTNFEKFQQVRTHYRTEHDERGYLICCNRKFYKRCIALEHAQRHKDPESFRCTICQKQFTNKNGLLVHVEGHNTAQEKPFQCLKCPKRFAKKFQLYKHQIQHIPEEEKKFICGECGKAFAKNSILQSHKRIVHDGAHVHVCEICAKSYKSKTFYERHYQIVHCNNIPPKLQCQLCGIWLKKDSLRKHMINHSEEGKLHVCNICGKHAPNSRALQSHMNFTHLAERNHKCSICEKAFKRPLELKEHMTLHTGEALYTCPNCPRTFNSGSNMRSHRKKVHPIEWEESRRDKMFNKMNNY